ncbi:hypothetical protein PHJA_001474600 [Phtheirospermum japonicum]|uniref:Uncharacterized protein n=1 Tax=Phtheirospermum japonicum TaxID=374723 RepID=A0A830C542_9LAMI|nr:hypothetical protein PHJA_001474600 [Phtheirospermum japonicum]
MSTQTRNDDAPDLHEAEKEEELLKLEEEVEQIAQKVIDYRTTLPEQLRSTLSSYLASQRPVLPTRLVNGGPDPEIRTLTGPESEAGVGEGLTRENVALSVTEDTKEAEKIQLIKQKISSNTAELPGVLNRMKEYMGPDS